MKGVTAAIAHLITNLENFKHALNMFVNGDHEQYKRRPEHPNNLRIEAVNVQSLFTTEERFNSIRRRLLGLDEQDNQQQDLIEKQPDILGLTETFDLEHQRLKYGSRIKMVYTDNHQNNEPIELDQQFRSRGTALIINRRIAPYIKG